MITASAPPPAPQAFDEKTAGKLKDLQDAFYAASEPRSLDDTVTVATACSTYLGRDLALEKGGDHAPVFQGPIVSSALALCSHELCASAGGPLELCSEALANMKTREAIAARWPAMNLQRIADILAL